MSGAQADRAILIVEDDEDIRETIVDGLRDEGFEAIGAEDGVAAIELLRSRAATPALIFLDLMMPRMSGADFLRAQRADPELADIPVVIISAVADVSTKAKELGVAEFLRKPIKLEVLIQTAGRFVPR